MKNDSKCPNRLQVVDASVTKPEAEISCSLSEHLTELRGILRMLQPTGQCGFEGLVAVALNDITGIPFRLAGGGSQFGIDGKPAYSDDTVCFEAKRYDDSISRGEILTKIAEVSFSDSETDLWVLGATSAVKSQLADDLRKFGERSGIGTLILDWTDIDIPPLAVALAMAEPAVVTFLASHINDPAQVDRVKASLRVITQRLEFARHSERIRSALRDPLLGMGVAKSGNCEWLTAVFSQKRLAKQYIGQPLAPEDSSGVKTLKRNALVDCLRPFLTEKSDGTVAAVHGDEGNGKSWLVAQSWLCLEEKPMMVVLTADDFVNVSIQDNLEEKIIGKLVQQTGSRPSEWAPKSWRRKWERWRIQKPPNSPRLVVFIDGLNQRPEVDWARHLEDLRSKLNCIGGRLIITTRSLYFRDWIKPRLDLPVTEIEVPQWSSEERNEILAAHGIKEAELQAIVAKSLRNPRLLGIALELFEKDQIRDLDELSASRLLFEHIRASQLDASSPQPAHKFAKILRNHANEIICRLAARQLDDLKIFEGDLEAVTDGRFFVPVDGDPTRYALADDGLTLALGFSVLDRLQIANRNGHDLDTALVGMIEPISALDVTAEAIIAGLTIAFLNEDCPDDIAVAVARAFAGVQNPNTSHFSGFAVLARQHPRLFTIAARDLCLAGGLQPNFDWFEAALNTAKTDDAAWSEISEHLRSWMSLYSLLPERGMISIRSHAPAEKVEIERQEKKQEINERLGSLSTAEKKLLESLQINDEANLNILMRFGFKLIAGKQVAPFASGFVQWSFANALNFDLGAPTKEFMQLVRFNGTDWLEAREAILLACSIFEAPDASPTGKSALVRLLQATGDPRDARRAERLVAELRGDRPRLEGWRLVEKFCESDPCDPHSEQPGNIAGTAENYAAIDVSKIRVSNGSSSEDHFFSLACLGVARFYPQVAVDKHREFIVDVLCRKGFKLYQGQLEVRRHGALLTRNQALELVKNIQSGTAGHEDDTLQEDDRWIVSQYRRFMAFPHLTAPEQLEVFNSQPREDAFLADLMDVVKPLDEGAFKKALRRANEEEDEFRQFRILAFGANTDTRISDGAMEILRPCVCSDHACVRALALRLIAKLGNIQLIDLVLQSGWSGAQLPSDCHDEAWFGSAVILEATAQNMIPYDQAIERISPQFYGWAAKRLNDQAKGDIANRVGASMLRIIDLPSDHPIPNIEIDLSLRDHKEPTPYNASDRMPDSDYTLETPTRFSDTDEAFARRRNDVLKAFVAFKADLTQEKARIILNGIRMDEMDAIAATDWKVATMWNELLITLPAAKLAEVCNVAYLFAHALSAKSPRKAACLFTRLADIRPLIAGTFGGTHTSYSAMTIWSAKDCPELNALRFKRLDECGNDYNLSLEVLAALRNSRDAVLQSYIGKQLRTREPVRICRALMVAGFSTRNSYVDDVLASYRNTAGFIGKAHAAAIYAYERNVWAEHWFRQMFESEKNEDFWRYSILFTKVVDVRFDIWGTDDCECGKPFRMFWPSIESQVKHRLRRWQSHRKRKLFGGDAPDSIFFAG